MEYNELYYSSALGSKTNERENFNIMPSNIFTLSLQGVRPNKPNYLKIGFSLGLKLIEKVLKCTSGKNARSGILHFYLVFMLGMTRFTTAHHFYKYAK